MEDDGVVRQFVQVGDGGKKNRGSGGDGDELPRADGGENGEQRVSIVSNRLDLSWAALVS